MCNCREPEGKDRRFAILKGYLGYGYMQIENNKLGQVLGKILI